MSDDDPVREDVWGDDDEGDLEGAGMILARVDECRVCGAAILAGLDSPPVECCSECRGSVGS